MQETNQKTENFLDIRDLTVEYTSNGEVVHAVNGVSLKLERGKTLGLVGETGAGKTTIAKTILRILRMWRQGSRAARYFITAQISSKSAKVI